MTLTKEERERLQELANVRVEFEYGHDNTIIGKAINALAEVERERDALDKHYCALIEEAKRQIAAWRRRAEKADR